MRLDRTSFGKRMGSYAEAIKLPAQPVVEGRLLRMVGLTLEAEGLRTAVGSRCLVINDDSYHPVQVEAEVMGFAGNKVFLMPVGSIAGIAPGARVVPLDDSGRLPMGMSMLGRVLDGAGRALDGKGGMKAEDWVPMDGPVINPLNRDPISQPLDVGIRSINGLLTVGRGQRLGLFAGTGVGKSVLLGMMTRFTEAEIIVVGLIGERGREVKEFIEHILGEEGLKRSVVVASPADDAPLMRLRAAMIVSAPFSAEAGPAGRRALANACLALQTRLDGGEAARAAFAGATNMTDRLAALVALIDIGAGAEALAAFEAEWKADRLVMDKWFMVQVVHAPPGDLAATVERLTARADFNMDNPNRFRAVFGALAANHAGFHHADGAAYALLADWLLRLDARNPQTAARMSTAFETWRRYDSGRQALIRAALSRMAATPGLSRDLSEMTARMLG